MQPFWLCFISFSGYFDIYTYSTVFYYILNHGRVVNSSNMSKMYCFVCSKFNLFAKWNTRTTSGYWSGVCRWSCVNKSVGRQMICSPFTLRFSRRTCSLSFYCFLFPLFCDSFSFWFYLPSRLIHTGRLFNEKIRPEANYKHKKVSQSAFFLTKSKSNNFHFFDNRSRQKQFIKQKQTWAKTPRTKHRYKTKRLNYTARRANTEHKAAAAQKKKRLSEGGRFIFPGHQVTPVRLINKESEDTGEADDPLISPEH